MLRHLVLLAFFSLTLITTHQAYSRGRDGDDKQPGEKLSKPRPSVTTKSKPKLRDLPFPEPDSGKLTMLPGQKRGLTYDPLTKDTLSVVFSHVPAIYLGVTASCHFTFCTLIEQEVSKRLARYTAVPESGLINLPYAAKFKMLCLLESQSKIGQAARDFVARNLQRRQALIIPLLHVSVYSYGCPYIDDQNILDLLDPSPDNTQLLNFVQSLEPHHFVLFRHFPSVLSALSRKTGVEYWVQIKSLTDSEVEFVVSALQSDKEIRKGLERKELIGFGIYGVRNPFGYILSNMVGENRLEKLNSLVSLFPECLTPYRAQLFRDLCLNLASIYNEDEREYLDRVKQVVAYAPDHTDLVLDVLPAFDCLAKCTSANELNAGFIWRVEAMLKSEKPFVEIVQLIKDESRVFLKQKEDFANCEHGRRNRLYIGFDGGLNTGF